MEFNGTVFTVFTAFSGDGSIDWAATENYIGFLYDGGARDFYVMPYNSRYSQLRESEIFELNDFAIRAGRGLSGSRCIVADSIHGPTSLKVEYARRALDAGADAFSSIFREKFFSIEQVVAHYQTMAQVGIPLVVHEMAFLSGYTGANMAWPDRIFSELATIPEIVAVKEDAKNPQVTGPLLENFGSRFQFIIAGRKRFLMPYVVGGHHAYLNGSSLVEPGIARKFWELAQSGDSVALDHFVARVDDPFWDESVAEFGWHRVNKAALAWRKLMGPVERLPLLALDEGQRARVGAVVDRILEAYEEFA